MRYKAFNLRYKMLAPFNKLLRTDDRATEDCHLILQCIEDKIDTKQSEVSMSWAFGKRHVFLRYKIIIDDKQSPCNYCVFLLARV